MAVLGALGDLVLALSADTAKFQSDLGRANRMAEKWGKDVGRVLGNVAGALLALGGSGAFGALVKGQIDAADAAGKMSQKIGVSTEALSAYMVAARLSDVSNEQLQTGFQQLAKNQADFVAGTGEAESAFKALGISQAQVKALNGDTAALFDLVAGKLAGFADGANKTALAMKIFGKSGAELIPMINSLEETKRLATELGLVYDKDIAAASERFNDNMTMVGLSVQALGLGIAKGVLPSLEAMSQRMASAAKDTEAIDKAARIADTGIRLLATGGTIVTAVFKLVGDRLGAIASAATFFFKGEWMNAARVLAGSFEDTVETVRGTIKSIDKLWDETAKTVEAKSATTGKKLAAPVLVSEKETKDALARKKKALDQYINGLEVQQKIIDEAAEASTEVRRGQDDQKKRRDEASEAIRRQLDPMREMRAEVERINELIAAGPTGGGLTPEDGMAALERLPEQWRKSREELVSYNEAAKDGDDIAKELGLSFKSAFEDAVVEGKKLSDVLKALGQDIARLLLRKSVTEPLAKAGSDFLGGLDFGGLIKGMFNPRGTPINPDAGASFGGLQLAGGMERVPFDGMPATLHKDEAVLSAADAAAWRNGRGGNTFIINPPPGADPAWIAFVERRINALAGPGVVERRAVAAVSERARR